MKKAEELAASHWAYVQGVLEAHGVDTVTVSIVGHHYRTSFVHGFKHGVEEKER